MSCQIQADEHRKCDTGQAGVHPGLQNGILLNYTRIENAHKVRKETFDFCYLQTSCELLVFL